MRQSNRSQWLTTLLLGGFGGAALMLAIMGVGSVLGYSVVQRRSEIGIRMALGAQPRDVLRLVLSQGLRLAALGIAIGIVAAGALTRLISGFLFHVRSADPLPSLRFPPCSSPSRVWPLIFPRSRPRASIPWSRCGIIDLHFAGSPGISPPP